MAPLTIIAPDRGGIEDLGETSTRVDSVGTSVRLVLVLCAAALAYALATFDSPNRSTILAAAGVGAALALGVAVLPAERIVRSRWREAFFLSWSVSQVIVVAIMVAADAGLDSPLRPAFFLPLILAALSYPLTSVVTVGALVELAYVGFGVRSLQVHPEDAGFFAVCLACAAMVCSWHARNQDERRRRIAELSRTDPLTGALNRRGFGERFDAELLQSVRTGQPLSLLLLDLDRFKAVNDQQGHAAGDALLRWVVATAGAGVRPMDAVGRLGGDEFAVLLPRSGAADAQAASERLVAALAERAPSSIGVVSFPVDGSSTEELLRRADERLYAHKRSDGPGPESLGVQLSWATALARAVDERMGSQHDHSGSVARLTVALAHELPGAEDDIDLEHLRIAAMLHDVGKVAVPDRILQKSGPLSAEERAEMEQHPVVGADMIARVEGLDGIVMWIRHSHEHFDGSGYPARLRGDAIPLASRMLLVADAFDAMTSHRVYHPAMSRAEAVAELRREAGRQFDPDCVTAFERLLNSLARSPVSLVS